MISNIELENDFLIVYTEDDLKAKQVNDILISNLVKRKIDPKSIKEFKRESASGNTIRILFSIIDGIDKEDAKKINLEIKKSKLKVKSQIQLSSAVMKFIPISEEVSLRIYIYIIS